MCVVYVCVSTETIECSSGGCFTFHTHMWWWKNRHIHTRGRKRVLYRILCFEMPMAHVFYIHPIHFYSTPSTIYLTQPFCLGEKLPLMFLGFEFYRVLLHQKNWFRNQWETFSENIMNAIKQNHGGHPPKNRPK